MSASLIDEGGSGGRYLVMGLLASGLVAYVKFALCDVDLVVSLLVEVLLGVVVSVSTVGCWSASGD